ncbi:carboxypeptidase-like regulatory domain-containing protein [Ichthyobacterium seriolicida]|uniref:Uncharacterized protein n=1 Tax=Ichthyobacterium seriolicida TaxID=242600 RepID=A0A1J1DZ82_9FLAO|nr:carboxypeptidase-like regulatory domain-containing protein [Ichthyobacterium seriolicida]BAV95201.1 hypothetical protein JBKA6_1188 [Ichthyobacterium seriolicida]
MYHGEILDSISRLPIPSVQILNPNTYKKSIANEYGQFTINASVGDTLIISGINYYTKHVLVKESKGDEIKIFLSEKTFNLRQIVLISHNLTGILEIDVKKIKDKNISTLKKFPGFKTSEDLGNPKPAEATIFQPIDFLYDLFNSRYDEIKKLKVIRKKQAFIEKLNINFVEDLITRLSSVSKKEINEILNYCKYSKSSILELSDMEIIQSLKECYESYKLSKKGVKGN